MESKVGLELASETTCIHETLSSSDEWLESMLLHTHERLIPEYFRYAAFPGQHGPNP